MTGATTARETKTITAITAANGDGADATPMTEVCRSATARRTVSYERGQQTTREPVEQEDRDQDGQEPDER